MKLFCLLAFVVVSCKSVGINNTGASEKEAGHTIEITLVNTGANYSAIVSTIQKSGFSPQMQNYPASNVYQSLIIISFTCSNMSEAGLAQLKNSIGCCKGVINIHDTEIN